MRAGVARILLTGAGGFVGPHVRTACAVQFPEAEIVAGTADVTDISAVRAMVVGARPNAVVHLAGIASVPAARAEPERAFAVNLGGTLAVAHAMLEQAPEALLIFAGSAECYGASFRAGTALDETAALAPLNVYAASKAAADLALGALAAESGLRTVRLRPFNHTGPGQSDAFVIAAFAAQIARIRRGEQPPVIRVGNLDAARDFLDVRDVARAYALAIARADELPPGTILNIASGTARPIGDILERMIATADMEIAVEIDPARLRPVDIPIACGNAAKARDLLGWTPEIDFETTLREVLGF
ncbi:MAG: GDP-mannose 4,6-dehydratase [Acidiphilium sp.]